METKSLTNLPCWRALWPSQVWNPAPWWTRGEQAKWKWWELLPQQISCGPASCTPLSSPHMPLYLCHFSPHNQKISSGWVKKEKKKKVSATQKAAEGLFNQCYNVQNHTISMNVINKWLTGTAVKCVRYQHIKLKQNINMLD